MRGSGGGEDCRGDVLGLGKGIDGVRVGEHCKVLRMRLSKQKKNGFLIGKKRRGKERDRRRVLASEEREGFKMKREGNVGPFKGRRRVRVTWQRIKGLDHGDCGAYFQIYCVGVSSSFMISFFFFSFMNFD